jgi:hypothetical protein
MSIYCGIVTWWDNTVKIMFIMMVVVQETPPKDFISLHLVSYSFDLFFYDNKIHVCLKYKKHKIYAFQYLICSRNDTCKKC